MGPTGKVGPMTVYAIFAEDFTVVGGSEFVGVVETETSAILAVDRLNESTLGTDVQYRYEELILHTSAGALLQAKRLM